jgi:hypothetical protein
MPFVALLLASLGTATPPPAVDFTGVPQILWSAKYRIETSSVRITLDPKATATARFGTYRTETVTLVKTEDQAFAGRLLVPRRRWGDSASGNPSWMSRLTVDGQTVNLRPISERGTATPQPNGAVEYSSDLAVDLTFHPRRTYVIKTTTELPIGRAGYEGKQRTVAFLAAGEAPVTQFQASYRYDETSVFGLPEMSVGGPKQPAQVGATGTFFRRENFRLPGEPVFLTFFPPALN